MEDLQIPIILDFVTTSRQLALIKAGWDFHKQTRENVYFTAGRIFVIGKKTARGKKSLLMSDNLPNNSHDSSKEVLICKY